MFIRGSYSPLLSLSCFSCFSWLNNSFDIRVHLCPFVVLTLFCHLFRVFSWLNLSFAIRGPFAFIRGSYSLLLYLSCFSWLNPSFAIRGPFVSIRGSFSLPLLSFVFFVFFVVKKHTIYIFSWFVPFFSILQSVMPSLKIAISWQWLTSLRARFSPDATVRTVSRNSSTFGFAMASQSIQCGFFCARE